MKVFSKKAFSFIETTIVLSLLGVLFCVFSKLPLQLEKRPKALNITDIFLKLTLILQRAETITLTQNQLHAIWFLNKHSQHNIFIITSNRKLSSSESCRYLYIPALSCQWLYYNKKRNTWEPLMENKVYKTANFSAIKLLLQTSKEGWHERFIFPMTAFN